MAAAHLKSDRPSRSTPLNRSAVADMSPPDACRLLERSRTPQITLAIPHKLPIPPPIHRTIGSTFASAADCIYVANRCGLSRRTPGQPALIAAMLHAPPSSGG